MKHSDIWISIVLVIALSGLALFSHSYIVGAAAEISAFFPGIGAAIEREDWEDARSRFSYAKERWEHVSKIWPMLINHDDMRDVEISFVDMEVLLTQENSERAARELANLGYYLEHVPDSEHFSWQNIL